MCGRLLRPGEPGTGVCGACAAVIQDITGGHRTNDYHMHRAIRGYVDVVRNEEAGTWRFARDLAIPNRGNYFTRVGGHLKPPHSDGFGLLPEEEEP